jgi:signal transduction histidine kinase
MLTNTSIRTRIALSIFALAAGLLIVMSVLVYIAFEQQLRASLDDTLRLQAASNLERVDTSAIPPILAVGSDPGQERFAGEAVLRLYDVNANMLVDGSPASASADDERDVVRAAIAANQDVYRTIELSENEAYRVLASPVRQAGTITGILVTGIEWSRVNQPLETLRLILVIAIALTALALAGGAYFVARRALYPVALITAAARRITSSDLHQRIASTSIHDELGELTSTLNSMIARLADTVDRERRFTADAAHELRTPLATITAGIDVMLLQDRHPDEYRRLLSIIREQTQGLTVLSQQLLLLSRLDTQDVWQDLEIIELTGLVDAIAEAFQDVHPDVTLSQQLLDAPLSVRGDPELITRAVVNILDNAVIHVGPTVRLHVIVHRTAEGSAQIVVTDDGPGIPQDLAPAVFQRFRLGDASRSQGGSGLGLAIVDAIMHGHRGSVRLLPSQKGEGARFALTFPLASALQAEITRPVAHPLPQRAPERPRESQPK